MTSADYVVTELVGCFVGARDEVRLAATAGDSPASVTIHAPAAPGACLTNDY